MLAVIGLGKLGLPLACVLVEAGYDVAGFDLPSRLAEIQANGAYSWEKGLPELWEKVKEKITLRERFDMLGLTSGDIAFICVQTPSKPLGALDLSFIEKAISGLRCKVVLCSTVAPGDCRRLGIGVYFPPVDSLG